MSLYIRVESRISLYSGRITNFSWYAVEVSWKCVTRLFYLCVTWSEIWVEKRISSYSSRIINFSTFESNHEFLVICGRGEQCVLEITHLQVYDMIREMTQIANFSIFESNHEFLVIFESRWAVCAWHDSFTSVWYDSWNEPNRRFLYIWVESRISRDIRVEVSCMCVTWLIAMWVTWVVIWGGYD